MGIFSLFSHSLIKNNYVFFDVETTGIYPFEGNRIIEIAMIKTSNGEIIDTFSSLLNPQIPIPPEITQTNNITDEMIKDAPVFDREFSEKILKFIDNNILVAHNANFDLSFLSYEFARNSISFQDWSAIDSLKIAQTLFPGQKNKLESLIKRYNIIISGDYHRAFFDTECLKKIFFEMLDEPEIRNKSIDFIIKKYGYCGINIHKDISAKIRELLIEKKEFKGKYKRRDGKIIEICVKPIAPCWNNNKWYLLSKDFESDEFIVLYCPNFIEIY